MTDTPVSTEHRSSILERSDDPIPDGEPPQMLCYVQLPLNWQQALIDDIAAAHHSIKLCAMSMLPPRQSQHGPWTDAFAALASQASNGVDVHLTLPAPHRAHGATSRNAHAATAAHAAGWRVTLLPGPRLLHAKLIIIDEGISWIGSANLTTAAWSHNHERYVRVRSAIYAARLALGIPTP